MSVARSVLTALRSQAQDPVRLLSAASAQFGNKIGVMSSFGAESALLLAFVAEVDRDMPVLFLETGKHFPETLTYRAELARFLGLKNVIDIRPAQAEVQERDPTGELWAFDPDACCRLRKVEPLDLATLPYEALVTGRKRSQATTRAALPVVEEKADSQLRLNPLALWQAEDITREIARRGLPPHPLVAEGYPSIGCAPCTRPVGQTSDQRAGRWVGLAKTECGIHTAS